MSVGTRKSVRMTRNKKRFLQVQLEQEISSASNFIVNHHNFLFMTHEAINSPSVNCFRTHHSKLDTEGLLTLTEGRTQDLFHYAKIYIKLLRNLDYSRQLGPKLKKKVKHLTEHHCLKIDQAGTARQKPASVTGGGWPFLCWREGFRIKGAIHLHQLVVNFRPSHRPSLFTYCKWPEMANLQLYTTAGYHISHQHKSTRAEKG